jgi:deferrochelatase/peroxidase EfeB
VLGADDFAANDFGYESAWLDTALTTPPTLRADAVLPRQVARVDGFPPAAADDGGFLCPHSSHLRKINPRDQSTDIGGPDTTLHRRILRRGIPFGPPYTDDTADAERGLLFTSYQASITASSSSSSPTGSTAT